MRALAIILASSSFFCSSAQELAKLQGIVRNAITGEPLDRVHIGLLVSVPDSGFKSVYGAVSDSEGRFSMLAINPGAYVLVPERSGWCYAPRKPQTSPSAMTLKAGQTVENYQISMAPRAVISGVVLDQAGDPVRKAGIHAEPGPSETVPLEFRIGVSGFGYTNDRGQYRISVPAGKYRVKAEPIGRPSNEPEEVRTDGTAPVVEPITWYPRASSPAAASVVEARAGSETGGIDIRVGQPLQLRIDGIVTGIPGGAHTLVNINALMHGGNSIDDIVVSPDGRFSAGRLEQGTYFLFAWTNQNNHLQSAVAQIELSDASVSNLVLALQPPATIMGVLEMEPGAGSATNRMVRLEPLTGAGNFGQSLIGDLHRGTAGKDGTFEIAGVNPERYRVSVRPLEENSYVKIVRLDEAIVPAAILDLRDGVHGSKLTVTVSSQGARISGVLKSNSEIVSPLAKILLVPEGTEAMQELWRATSIDPGGAYYYQGLAPGKYKLFAIDHVAGISFRDRLSGAEIVELKEDDRVTKDLRMDDFKN